MKPGRMLIAALGVAALVGGGAYLWSRDAAPTAPTAVPLSEIPDSLKAPDGVRVRVEVLNASQVRGLARRATQHLRDRGFDVVGMGNAGQSRDTTLVLVRGGDPEWAQRVARAMGAAAVEQRPDSSRHLDVTVLVGATWRPPPGPLRP